MAYRCVVRSTHSTRWSTACGIVVALVLFLAACGGSDDVVPLESETAEDATTERATTPIPEPTDEPIVVPTSTPLPTATPLPTSTPVPLAAPTPSAILLDSAFTNDSKITTVGIDEVFFGMRPEEAAEAASTEWLGESSSTSTCYQIAPTKGPNGVVLWVVDGFIERVDIEHPDLRTPSKLGVGNTLGELQSQLGDRLSEETAEDGTVVATFTPADAGDANFRLIFELVDDSVVRYRSGRVGVVERASGDCFSSINSTE